MLWLVLVVHVVLIVRLESLMNLRELMARVAHSLDWIKPFTHYTTTYSYIKENSRYFPHFKVT